MSRAQPQWEGSLELPSIYASYLCRKPAGDVPLLINNGPDEYTALLRTLQRSAEHWAEKEQARTVERIQFEIARLHMQNKQWQRAMRTLVPLWQTLTWRQTGWWSMLEEVDWALKECACNVRDAETLVTVEWELMNRCMCIPDAGEQRGLTGGSSDEETGKPCGFLASAEGNGRNAGQT